jgi:hypothetical protein
MAAKKEGSAFKVLALIVVGLAVLFTLLGGAGTTCIAFSPEAFGDKWAPFIQIKPIMQMLVVVSLAAAVAGIWTMANLARSRKHAYLAALIVLVVGGIASAIQYYYSYTLRDGSTAPNNIRLFITLLALVVLLVLRLPGIWNKTGLDSSGGGSSKDLPGMPVGMALMAAGAVTLAAPLWAGPTHEVAGANAVMVMLWQLEALGSGLTGLGMVLLWRTSHARRAARFAAVQG